MSTTSPAQGTSTQPITLRDRFSAWTEIMQTANAPVDKPLDGLGKWLVMTRAAVFPMTLWSGTIGALLAVEQARLAPAGTISIDWIAVVLAVIGIVLAHAANNLINDYFDMTGGIDTDGYVRALYAPHPVLSGWVTKATLRNVMVALTVLGGLIMLLLAYWHGPLVIVFALAGLFLSVFYVAPPFSLKRHGLGELDVFLTWGPLMIGGTYLVAVTPLDPSKLIGVMLFSMPYALLVTSVLFGKHIDKIEPDTKLGIHTVPVILGEKLARRTNQALMILSIRSQWPRCSRAGWVRGCCSRCWRSPPCGACCGSTTRPSPPARHRGTRRAAGRCGSSASPSATSDSQASC